MLRVLNFRFHSKAIITMVIICPWYFSRCSLPVLIMCSIPHLSKFQHSPFSLCSPSFIFPVPPQTEGLTREMSGRALLCSRDCSPLFSATPSFWEREKQKRKREQDTMTQMKNTAVCLSPKQKFNWNCILLRAHFTEGHQNTVALTVLHFNLASSLIFRPTHIAQRAREVLIRVLGWNKREVMLWRWRLIVFRPVIYLIKTPLHQNKSLINSLYLCAHHLQRRHL